MTALEFIHKHREDEDSCECLILPDGSVEEPVPSGKIRHSDRKSTRLNSSHC